MLEIETRNNVRYIICAKDKIKKLGRLVATSNKTKIYQSFSNPKIAYKVYHKTDSEEKNNLNPSWDRNIKSEHQLIYNLSTQQKSVHLTEFPTGIIAFKERLIGQEIVYYENFISLDKFANENNSSETIFWTPNIYLSMLNILRELLDNGIFYEDIRCYNSNFIVLPSTLGAPTVKLIDFENGQVWFVNGRNETEMKDFQSKIIRDLCSLINQTNRSFGLFDNNFVFSEMPESFDKMEEYVNKMNKLLQRR